MQIEDSVIPILLDGDNITSLSFDFQDLHREDFRDAQLYYYSAFNVVGRLLGCDLRLIRDGFSETCEKVINERLLNNLLEKKRETLVERSNRYDIITANLEEEFSNYLERENDYLNPYYANALSTLSSEKNVKKNFHKDSGKEPPLRDQ